MVLDGNEPVFSEPWEAQAFGLTVGLYDGGLFTWEEWAAALSGQIHSGDDLPYYRHWLIALENLMEEKNITSADALKKREQEWHDAAARTPHGEPIEL